MILAPGESVDLWTIPLEVDGPLVDRLRGLLDSEETERLQRFRFESLQRHFAVAHGALRLVLSSYLNREPASLHFTLGHRKKPSIDGIEFNLTHSGSLAVLAVADCAVGVDVEVVRPLEDMLAVASRFFAPGEAAEIQAAADAARSAKFFNVWTRKEAFVKCLGDGLYLPLDSFRVSSGAEAEFLAFDDPTHRERWQIQAFDPGIGYAGAVVYPGRPRALRMFSCKDVFF